MQPPCLEQTCVDTPCLGSTASWVTEYFRRLPLTSAAKGKGWVHTGCLQAAHTHSHTSHVRLRSRALFLTNVVPLHTTALKPKLPDQDVLVKFALYFILYELGVCVCL